MVPEISWPEHGRRRKRDLRLHHVQVGVADAARMDLDEHLAGARLGHGNLARRATRQGRRSERPRSSSDMAIRYCRIPRLSDSVIGTSMSCRSVSVGEDDRDDRDDCHADQVERQRAAAVAELQQAVAMIGDSPPARTDDSCAPSDAPLYRTRVPNSSERKAACGAYIAAWEDEAPAPARARRAASTRCRAAGIADRRRRPSRSAPNR